jgi:hypothetical protein
MNGKESFYGILFRKKTEHITQHYVQTFANPVCRRLVSCYEPGYSEAIDLPQRSTSVFISIFASRNSYPLSGRNSCILFNEQPLPSPNQNNPTQSQPDNAAFRWRLHSTIKQTYHRDGPLFQGRYKACLIDAENYLIQTSKYIHLNPVAAKIVTNPEDYMCQRKVKMSHSLQS